MPLDGRHDCPRFGCGRRVPDNLFACPHDWAALPAHVQRQITDTAGVSIFHADRHAAVWAAQHAWTALDERDGC